MSSLHIEMTQVVEFLPQVRQDTYSTYVISNHEFERVKLNESNQDNSVLQG